MPSTVVVGGFFGDEGKGKIISYLAKKDNPTIVVRGGAGPNAGHTIKDGNNTYKVRMLPSGFLNKNARVMHLDQDSKGRLKEKIGSTGSGTGPANAERAMRTLKIAKDIETLSSYIKDVPDEINSALKNKEEVLVEGTQGTHLSLWHGTYPFVTSKDVTAAGICADVGLGPKNVNEVLIVFKAYLTRVGTGPMPGELGAEETEKKGWAEFGTVTGRPRRAAEFDFNLAQRAVMLNSATQIAITKLDVRFPECSGVKSMNELSNDAKSFIKNIEEKLEVPVTLIGTGPLVDDVVDLRT